MRGWLQLPRYLEAFDGVVKHAGEPLRRVKRTRNLTRVNRKGQREIPGQGKCGCEERTGIIFGGGDAKDHELAFPLPLPTPSLLLCLFASVVPPSRASASIDCCSCSALYLHRL